MADFYKFWDFKISGTMSGMFVEKTSDIVVDYNILDLTTRDFNYPKETERIENIFFKILRDFCPNSNFEQDLMTEMMNLTVEVLKKSQVIEELLCFCEDTSAFLEPLFYQRKEKKMVKITEFENRFKEYEKVDEFVNDLINTMMMVFVISKHCDKFEGKIVKKIYDFLIKIHTFSFIFPAMVQKEKDSMKIKTTLLVFESLKIASLGNIFTFLVQEPRFCKIRNFEKYLYSLVTSDS